MSRGAGSLFLATSKWIELELKMPPSRCLDVSDVSRLPSLGDGANRVSRPLRATQLTLVQTEKSDCVN